MIILINRLNSLPSRDAKNSASKTPAATERPGQGCRTRDWNIHNDASAATATQILRLSRHYECKQDCANGDLLSCRIKICPARRTCRIVRLRRNERPVHSVAIRSQNVPTLGMYAGTFFPGNRHPRTTVVVGEMSIRGRSDPIRSAHKVSGCADARMITAKPWRETHRQSMCCLFL
jgi:hypothetical protein